MARVELMMTVNAKKTKDGALRLMLFAFAILLMSSSSAWASAGELVEPAQRFPLTSLGIAMTLGGFWLGHVFTSWYEFQTRQKIQRVIGVIIATVGLYFVVFSATEAPPTAGELPWHVDYSAAVEAAHDSGRPMMVDFTADWCGACKELEAEVFHHADVRDRLASEVVLLKVDFDKDTPQNDDLRKRFKVSGLPRIAFVGADGTFLEAPSFEGKVGVDEFSKRLDDATSGSGSEGEEGEFSRTLREKGLLATLLLVFLAGVASSLTPCVYPLIPITIGLFGARQESSRLRSFLLSSTYVGGIVITYSILGVVAASVGAVFGGAMQSPWVLGGIALLFFVLGLSSLGVFQVRLPGNLQTALGQRGGNGFAGALVMGLVAGVIAAPCVGPIVGGVLVYVAKEQDLLLGWGLLATFALGMGMLFLVLGTFSSLLSKLPRSGGWMEAVKTIFGAVFLAMAVYYARFLFPTLDEWVKALWLLVG